MNIGCCPEGLGASALVLAADMIGRDFDLWLPASNSMAKSVELET